MSSVVAIAVLAVLLFGHIHRINGFSHTQEPAADVVADGVEFASGPPVIRVKRLVDNFNHTINHPSIKRTKRAADGAFLGHPKTREERWHAAFNLSRGNLQNEQAQSLVLLLVKVMDKYLNACTPIIFYDQAVESSEGNILQTFFQVNCLKIGTFRLMQYTYEEKNANNFVKRNRIHRRASKSAISTEKSAKTTRSSMRTC